MSQRSRRRWNPHVQFAHRIQSSLIRGSYADGAGPQPGRLLQGLIRRGLQEHPADQIPYRALSFAMGVPNRSVNLDKALAMAAGLEDDEIARTLNPGDGHWRVLTRC